MNQNLKQSDSFAKTCVRVLYRKFISDVGQNRHISTQSCEMKSKVRFLKEVIQCVNEASAAANFCTFRDSLVWRCRGAMRSWLLLPRAFCRHSPSRSTATEGSLQAPALTQHRPTAVLMTRRRVNNVCGSDNNGKSPVHSPRNTSCLYSSFSM